MITLYPLDAEQPETLRGDKLQRIKRLMDSPRQVKFYQSPEWVRMRRHVLERHNNECEICRSRGKYAKATMVHHVWHVTKHPELSLSEYYYSGGKAHAQLLALCHPCHEAVHQHRHAKKCEPITPERW